MPGRALFYKKHRPSGLEFPSCKECNHGTSAADSLVSFLSRIEPYGDVEPGDWKLEEAVKYLRSAESQTPGLIQEILGGRYAKDTFIRTTGGVLMPVVETQVGPIAQKLLGVWALKFGMAIYAEHVGKPVPKQGGAFGMWFLNAGIAEDVAATFLSILPVPSTLQQGKKTASGQFDYRFNTDEKSIAAALCHFHGNIHFFSIGFAEPETYRFPDRDLKHGVFARSGELLSLMPRSTPLFPLLNPLGANAL